MKKLDALVEMHLLLREHGWEPWRDPEAPDATGVDIWTWHHPGRTKYPGRPGFVSFGTWRNDNGIAEWMERTDKPSTSVASLRRRLKELARASTA